jgi:hypothetical protein
LRGEDEREREREERRERRGDERREERGGEGGREGESKELTTKRYLKKRSVNCFFIGSWR